VGIGTGLDQLGGQAEVLVRCSLLEAGGVGDQRDIQRRGDLGRQAHLQLREYVAQHLARGRGLGDHEIGRAKAAVCRGGGRSRRRRAPRCAGVDRRHATLVRRVEGQQRTAEELSGSPRTRSSSGMKRYRRKPGRAREEHRAALAELVERQLEAEHRAERVTVGALVHRDEKSSCRESLRDGF